MAIFLYLLTTSYLSPRVAVVYNKMLKSFSWTPSSKGRKEVTQIFIIRQSKLQLLVGSIRLTFQVHMT
jgi:hypothetical protein